MLNATEKTDTVSVTDFVEDNFTAVCIAVAEALDEVSCDMQIALQSVQFTDLCENTASNLRKLIEMSKEVY